MLRRSGVFPDQNRLIFIDGDNGGWSYNPATNSWSQLWFGFNGGGTPQLTMGHYTNFVAYSNLGFLVFGGGGGDNHVYKMNAAGTIHCHRIPSLWQYSNRHRRSLLFGRSRSGDGAYRRHRRLAQCLEFEPIIGKLVEYRNRRSDLFQSCRSGFDLRAISDYGVIMYVKCDRTSSCRAYLYKHGAGTPGTSDTTAPTNPSGLIATAISSSQINLSWTASTDAIGVTSYLIERSPSGCAAFAQINTSATNSFSDTGRTASTTYCYRIRATDAAGNLSGYTASVSGTTGTTQAPDTTAPTTPSGLIATAISAGQVNLAWTASTDAVGVTAYLLERCSGASCSSFAQIISQAAITYSDTALTSSTSYRYRVRATDAAGNLSSYSSIASATTSASATPPPGGGGSDFTSRCAAAGVLRCFSFDTDTDFAFGSGGKEGGRGLNFGYIPPGSNGDFTKITRDTTIKTSGASSLRLNIPGSGGPDVAGAWFANFSSDLSQQLQPGQDIWIQVRYRVDANFLNQDYGGGSHGFKILDISGGDRPGCAPGQGSALCPTTCWDGENVFTTERTGSGGHLLVAYSNCGGAQAFTNAYGITSNITVQNAVGCLYPSYVAPPCVYFTANEWWTMKIHLHIGTYGTHSSTYQIWAGRRGNQRPWS